MSGIYGISILRRHLGLTHDTDKWSEFRTTVTEIVCDHMDTSLSGLPAAKQGTKLDKAMKQVLRQYSQYFPQYSRDEDEPLLRRYVLERFHGARKALRYKKNKGGKVEKEVRPAHRPRRSPSSPLSDASYTARNNNRGPVVTVRPIRNSNKNKHPPPKQRVVPVPPPVRVVYAQAQARHVHESLTPLPQSYGDVDDLLTFLQNCKLPLPQLYPYLKNHGHTLNSVIAMSEWDFELIQNSFRHLASVSIHPSGSGGSTSAGTSSTLNGMNGRDNHEGPVTMAQWDLLAGYIYRLGH